MRASPDPARARAHVLAPAAGAGAALQAWIVAALALLAPGGRFLMIHRAGRAGRDSRAPSAGGSAAVAVRPVHPRADADAIRVLVGGIKGSKAPLRILPGLVLHEAVGRVHAAAPRRFTAARLSFRRVDPGGAGH